MTRRTFINNKNEIENLFNICIECEHFRYYIEEDDFMDEGNTRSWLLNAFSLNSMVGNSQKLKELKPEFDFEQEIFSNMDTMEVLEPLWLRDQIQERLKRMIEKYK